MNFILNTEQKLHKVLLRHINKEVRNAASVNIDRKSKIRNCKYGQVLLLQLCNYIDVTAKD